jgi:thiosulfate/3-mercaptopyruvate sulfurtransferase
MPSPRKFAEAMSRHGVADGTHVVLYTTGHPMWATRVWWLLRAFGFDHTAVMDGGFQRWVAEGREVSTAPCRYELAQFVSRPRPAVMADKAEVHAALSDPHVRLVNALSRRQHSGEGVHYGRPGRIPGSACVPAFGLVERGTSTFLEREALRAAFDAAQVESGQRVITYCGGGIAATCDAFVLRLLGHDDVAVYDGSLTEWSSDPSMPVETG